MHRITISRAGTAETGTIVSLSRQTFKDTFASANTIANMQEFMDGPFSEVNLAAEVHNADFHFFLARVFDRVVGYMKLVPNAQLPEMDLRRPMEISRIYVLQSSIGMGIGRRLMEFAIQYASELKLDSIWLGVWEHNIRAIKFYNSFGFRHVGEHDFMLGSDRQTDWLMERPTRLLTS